MYISVAVLDYFDIDLRINFSEVLGPSQLDQFYLLLGQRTFEGPIRDNRSRNRI